MTYSGHNKRHEYEKTHKKGNRRGGVSHSIHTHTSIYVVYRNRMSTTMTISLSVHGHTLRIISTPQAPDDGRGRGTRKSERRWASGRARAGQRRAARPRNLVIRRAGDCNNRPSSRTDARRRRRRRRRRTDTHTFRAHRVRERVNASTPTR